MHYQTPVKTFPSSYLYQALTSYKAGPLEASFEKITIKQNPWGPGLEDSGYVPRTWPTFFGNIVQIIHDNDTDEETDN